MPSSAGVATADALTYEPIQLAVDGEPSELSPGLFGVRFALPFALDHVNIWLLAEAHGWTLIDAGLADQPSRERWRDLAGFMAGRPVTRVLATHFHPDHMGLAGWWCERSGAELWASRTEWLQGRALALDHVNIWLLADDGWTLIDAGLADQPSRERWQDLAGFMAGRPVTRVLATHFHPDHIGLAGWWCERSGAELWASRTEWLQARALALDVSEDFVAAGRRFDHRAGLDADQVEERAARGNLYRQRVTLPPASYRRLAEGDEPAIAGSRWQVIVGRGHAPEMLCLFSAKRNLLIAADQVLPRISPIVGVWPGEPEANPLAEFLGSLATLRRLPDDCLVLPSHGRPFRGLHVRIDQLVAHHRERLAATLEACGRPATAVEIMPELFDRKLDRHQISFAIAETVAHLNYLLAEGRIKRRLGGDDRLRYQRR